MCPSDSVILTFCKISSSSSEPESLNFSSRLYSETEGKREKSQGHFHRNIKHAIGHVGKALSDLSPGTWANWKRWKQKARAAKSLTLTSPRLHLDELEKECEETDSWLALALLLSLTWVTDQLCSVTGQPEIS